MLGCWSCFLVALGSCPPHATHWITLPFVYSQLICLLPVRVLKHFVYVYLQCLLSICLNLRATSPSDCNCLVLPSVNKCYYYHYYYFRKRVLHIDQDLTSISPSASCCWLWVLDLWNLGLMSCSLSGTDSSSSLSAWIR